MNLNLQIIIFAVCGAKMAGKGEVCSSFNKIVAYPFPLCSSTVNKSSTSKPFSNEMSWSKYSLENLLYYESHGSEVFLYKKNK